MKTPHILILLTGLTLLSCKKLVEVDAPKNQIVTSTAFAQDETAIAALTGIYSRMNNDSSLPYNLTLQTALSGDEVKSYSNSTYLVLTYTNNLNQVGGNSTDFWTIWYNHIYQANAVWEGCNASNTLTPAVKKQLMAEALFIRAYWYFYLVNLYGNVPLILTTDYAKNATAANSSTDAVYTQIIADLVQAENNLNAGYVGLNSVSTISDRIRPNRSAAAALLARVYLYHKDWALAEQETTKVISNAADYSLAPIGAAFLRTSKEAIWQIAMPTPYGQTANTYEGLNFILTSKPLTNVINCITLSSQLYNSFEPGDLRQSNWVGKYTDVTVTPNIDYYFPYKYKVKNVTTSSTEYTTPLRLAEQFLIRAEARAQQGNVGQGKDDLNMVRHRAGLGDTPAADREALLSAILRERRSELFIEWGHRWMDLKRTGQIDAVMSSYAPLKNGAWSSFKALWPIPLREITNDVNLKQNPGYN